MEGKMEEKHISKEEWKTEEETEAISALYIFEKNVGRGMPLKSVRLGFEFKIHRYLWSVVAHTDEHGDVGGKSDGMRCWYSWGGSEYTTTNFSWILPIDHDVVLMRHERGPPLNAVKLGKDHANPGSYCYAGIAKTIWGLIPGNVTGNSCSYTYDGSEYDTTNFYWLVVQTHEMGSEEEATNNGYIFEKNQNGPPPKTDCFGYKIDGDIISDLWSAAAHTEEHGDVGGQGTENSCWYSWGGKKLTAEKFSWIVAKKGYVIVLKRQGKRRPSGAVEFRKKNDNSDPFYAAIANTKFGFIPGNVRDDVCWYSYGENEYNTPHFYWVVAMKQKIEGKMEEKNENKLEGKEEGELEGKIEEKEKVELEGKEEGEIEEKTDDMSMGYKFRKNVNRGKPLKTVCFGFEFKLNRPFWSVVAHTDEHGDVGGKADGRGDQCWYPRGGSEHTTTNFSWIVKTDHDMVLMKHEGGPPLNSVKLGKDHANPGSYCYAGIAKTIWGFIPGNVTGNSCSYTYDGSEYNTTDFYWLFVQRHEMDSEEKATINGYVFEKNQDGPPPKTVCFGYTMERDNILDLWSTVAHTEEHGDVGGKGAGNSCLYPWDGEELTAEQFSWIMATNDYDIVLKKKGKRRPLGAVEFRNKNDNRDPFYAAIARTTFGFIPGNVKDDICWYSSRGNVYNTPYFFWVVAMKHTLESRMEEKNKGKMEEGKEDKIEEDKEDKIEEGKEDKIEEGKEDKIEEGKEDKVEEGKEDKIEESKEDKLEEGKEDNLEEGKEDKLEEGGEDNIEEGKEDTIEEGKEDKIEEGKEDKIEEGKEDKIEEDKEDKLEEGEEDNIEKGKEDKKEEGKMEGNKKREHESENESKWEEKWTVKWEGKWEEKWEGKWKGKWKGISKGYTFEKNKDGPPPNAVCLGFLNDETGHLWSAVAHTKDHGDVGGKAKGDTCWYTIGKSEFKTSNFSWIVETDHTVVLEESQGKPPWHSVEIGKEVGDPDTYYAAVAKSAWGLIPGKAKGVECWYSYSNVVYQTSEFFWLVICYDNCTTTCCDKIPPSCFGDAPSSSFGDAPSSPIDKIPPS